MSLKIIKFGGTSVASIELIRNAADIAIATRKECGDLVVVVSAMGSQTNELISLLHEAIPNPTLRELDMIAATGEQVSSSLFASVLQAKGVPARSMTGGVAGFRTNSAHGNAKILDIDTSFLLRIISQGEIPVVAGFQGINELGEITTLGRGGTDISAAALGAALGAEECRIYTDVKGVYTADPRICEHARLIDEIHFDEVLEMAAMGAKVLHPRAIEHAGRNNLRMRVMSTFEPELPGTLIRFEQENKMEKPVVTGIAHCSDEAKITLRAVPDQPGVAAKVFSPIALANIDVDVIVQNIASTSKATDLSFTVKESDLERALECSKKIAAELGCEKVEHTTEIAKVSVIGLGMSGNAGIASRMFEILANAGVNILMISTSEIKISVIIEQDRVADAVQSLHSEFGLAQVHEPPSGDT